MKYFGIKGFVVAIAVICLTNILTAVDVYAGEFAEINIEESVYDQIDVANRRCVIEIFDENYEGVVTRTRKAELLAGTVWIIDEYIGTEGIVCRYSYIVKSYEVDFVMELAKTADMAGVGNDPSIGNEEGNDTSGKEEDSRTEEKVLTDDKGIDEDNTKVPVEDTEVEKTNYSTVSQKEEKKEDIFEESIPKRVKPVPKPKYEKDIIENETEEKVIRKRVKNNVLVVEDEVVPMASAPQTGDYVRFDIYLYMMMLSLILVGLCIKYDEYQKKVEEAKVRTK